MISIHNRTLRWIRVNYSLLSVASDDVSLFPLGIRTLRWSSTVNSSISPTAVDQTIASSTTVSSPKTKNRVLLCAASESDVLRGISPSSPLVSSSSTNTRVTSTPWLTVPNNTTDDESNHSSSSTNDSNERTNKHAIHTTNTVVNESSSTQTIGGNATSSSSTIIPPNGSKFPWLT